MAVSKGLRFEIFKRDGFRCVYCGSTPQDAPLHVDHVEPKAKGGQDAPENLVTSCASCNLGKSDTPLGQRRLPRRTDDDARAEQAEQLLAYLQHERELAQAREQVAEHVFSIWEELIAPYRSSRSYENTIRSLLRKYSLGEVIEALQIACNRNLDSRHPLDRIRYACGILRGWARDRGLE